MTTPEPASDRSANEIMVVDDDADLGRGIARILKAQGFTVHLATGGLDAIHLAEELRPGVVLMDITMPDLNGLEAARQLRMMLPDLAVIFMTGFSEFEQQARDEGAVAVLGKPVDYDRLFETLSALRLLHR